MIVSLGDGEDGPFSQAMKHYAGSLFHGKYPLRKLPPEHLLFTLSEKMTAPPDLRGVSNGVREVWVHSPVDLATTWQGLEYHLSDHWQLAINLMLYATGQERPRGRLESVAVPPAMKPAKDVTLARVKYKGNWDPEPGAWPRLAALMANDGEVGLNLVEVEASKLDVRTTPVAHVTGTEAFSPDDAEKAGLTAFLKQGGILIGDAAGGSEIFVRTFQEFAAAYSGQMVPEALQPNATMFDGSLAGSVKIGAVQYRRTPGPRVAMPEFDVPEIRVWKANGRTAVLFSRADITAGLLGTQAAGVVGFKPAVAQRVGRDLILYACSLIQAEK
jgi:hypothetical protein